VQVRAVGTILQDQAAECATCTGQSTATPYRNLLAFRAWSQPPVQELVSSRRGGLGRFMTVFG